MCGAAHNRHITRLQGVDFSCVCIRKTSSLLTQGGDTVESALQEEEAGLWPMPLDAPVELVWRLPE